MSPGPPPMDGGGGVGAPVASTVPTPVSVAAPVATPAPAPATGLDAAAVVTSLDDVTTRLRAAIAAIGAPAPAAPARGYVVPGRQADGTSAIPPATGAVPGLQLTTPADGPLVDGMLQRLRASPTGSQVLAGLERMGARVTVLDDAQFAATGHAASGAYYDPPSDTIVLRRSDLQSAPGRTAATFAHEGTHALDDAGLVGKAWLDREGARRAASGTFGAAQVEQLQSEYTLAKEARAFTVHVQVMRELGEQPEGLLADVVRTGGNDRATYHRIFTMLSQAGPAGGYNTSGAAIAPFEL